MRVHPTPIIRGGHVLAGLLGFFGIVIAVNATFITLALTSFPGEDVRRSYLQGLHYNATLEQRRAQAALGWRARAALRRTESGALLALDLRDRFEAPLDGLKIDGTLRWPTDSRKDRAIVFTPKGDGRYEARLGRLHEGQWRLRARAFDASGGALDFEADLSWPISP